MPIANYKRYLRRPTIIQSLLVTAIVAVAIALIVPGVQWAASGDIRFPVRVLVFDAVHGKPIADAHVAIFRALPLLSSKSLEEDGALYDPRKLDQISRVDRGATGADGTVIINIEFHTGANHERPTMYAHLRGTWVHVQAEGFGEVVVPIRHESLPTATLRKLKELVVPVGLVAIK
jgi:hypothetical protein